MCPVNTEQDTASRLNLLMVLGSDLVLAPQRQIANKAWPRQQILLIPSTCTNADVFFVFLIFVFKFCDKKSVPVGFIAEQSGGGMHKVMKYELKLWAAGTEPTGLSSYSGGLSVFLVRTQTHTHFSSVTKRKRQRERCGDLWPRCCPAARAPPTRHSKPPQAKALHTVCIGIIIIVSLFSTFYKSCYFTPTHTHTHTHIN